MPPRKPKAKAPDTTHELDAFAEKYDTHLMLYGDPVEKIFSIMSSSPDEDTQLRAAEILVSYRYPRLKALEGAGGPGTVVNIQINSNAKMPAALPPKPVLELER